MPSPSAIVDISVATIQGQLPAPVIFGDWVMNHREFVVVRLRTQSGHEGWSFTLTRDGACAEQIRKSIAPVYVGTDIADREKTFKTAKGRTYGSHSAGVGLRYITPFGPLRVDAAVPLNRGPGDPRFGIYAGIGQAF